MGNQNYVILGDVILRYGQPTLCNPRRYYSGSVLVTPNADNTHEYWQPKLRNPWQYHSASVSVMPDAVKTHGYGQPN